MKRFERWVPFVLAAVATLPSLLNRFPLGPDLSMHLYSISALRNYGNPAMFPPGLLRLNFGHPNQLFFFAATGLSYVVSLVASVKIMCALTSVVFVLGVWRLLHYLGKTPWALGLVVPTALGFAYYFGLQAFALGTGLLFCSLVELDRYCEAPSWKRGLLAGGWVVLLYAAHEQAMVVYSGAALGFALLSPRLRLAAARVMPFGLAVAVALTHKHLQQKLLDSTAIVANEPIWLPLKMRLVNMPAVLFGAHMRITTQLYAVVFLVAIGLLFFFARAAFATRAGGDLREKLYRWRYGLLAGVMWLFYFAGPNSIFTANYIAERFLPWGLLFTIVVVAPRAEAPLPRWVRAFLFVIPFGYELAMVPAMREVNASIAQVEELMPYIQPRSSIALLDADIEEPDAPFTAVYGDAYVAALKGGRPLHSWLYSTISVVQFRLPVMWKDSLMRLFAPKTFNFKPKFDLTAFRYVLVRSQSVAKNQLVTRLLQPEARFIASTGNWTLLESTLPVRPINVPFGSPYLCGDSLGDRLINVLDLINERDWLTTGVVDGGMCTEQGGEVGKAMVEIQGYMAKERDEQWGLKKKKDEAP